MRTAPSIPILFVLAACASPSSDAEAEASENAQTSCEAGFVLPDTAVDGYVVNTPVPAKKSLGISLGTLDEREPIAIDPMTVVTYGEHDGEGRVERRGYTFQAKRGERFAVDSFAPYPIGSFVVYGPIAGCNAPATDAPAPFEGIDGWRAPKDGTYFVTVGSRLYRESGGAIRLEPIPQASMVPTLLAMRRLLADDTPAGHAFVETQPLPLYGTTAMHVTKLAGDKDPSLLLIATKLPATNGGAAETPSLVVVRRGQAPIDVPSCAEGTSGVVAGDFDGDGVTDVLSGTNLFRGQAMAAGGGFTCEPSGLRAYNRVLGPVDIDGDGKLDVVGLQANLGGAASTGFYVTPYFRRGNAFVQGAYRSVTVPFGTTSFDGPRAAILDVNGDAKPEIAVVLGDKVAGLPLPVLAPEDATPPNPNGSPVVLTVAPVMVTQPLVPDEIDVGPQRTFDFDGDGIADRVTARPMFSYAGLAIAYGTSTGLRHAWDIPASQNLGDRPLLHHMDFDGDGCEDIVAGGYGLRVFRGLRCKK